MFLFRPLLSVVLLSLACAGKPQRMLKSSANVDFSVEFVKFVKDFTKTYQTSDLFSRYSNFVAEYKEVAGHNARYEAGQESYYVDTNQLSDLTSEEMKKYLGLLSTELSADVEYEVSSQAQLQATHASVDWRNVPKALAPIKEQGQCGACWAFSGVASLENTYALQTGQLKSFSEQMCIDCCSNGRFTCSSGGTLDACFSAVQTNGAMLSSDYPYEEASGRGCRYNGNRVVARNAFGSLKRIRQNSVSEIKAAVSQSVVAAAIQATDNMYRYAGGVYTDRSCTGQSSSLNHAINIVGYNKDSSGTEYWIVRNSWGSRWGVNGYFYLKMGQCGIEFETLYIAPTANVLGGADQASNANDNSNNNNNNNNNQPKCGSNSDCQSCARSGCYWCDSWKMCSSATTGAKCPANWVSRESSCPQTQQPASQPNNNQQQNNPCAKYSDCNSCSSRFSCYYCSNLRTCATFDIATTSLWFQCSQWISKPWQCGWFRSNQDGEDSADKISVDKVPLPFDGHIAVADTEQLPDIALKHTGDEDSGLFAGNFTVLVLAAAGAILVAAAIAIAICVMRKKRSRESAASRQERGWPQIRGHSSVAMVDRRGVCSGRSTHVQNTDRHISKV